MMKSKPKGWKGDHKRHVIAGLKGTRTRMLSKVKKVRPVRKPVRKIVKAKPKTITKPKKTIEEEIIKLLEEVDCEWVEVTPYDQSIDFEYDDAREEININTFVIQREDAIDILKNDENTLTTNWEGTVLHRYEDGEEVEVIQTQAYGGFSNTDGISESGELYVDRDLLPLEKKRYTEY